MAGRDWPPRRKKIQAAAASNPSPAPPARVETIHSDGDSAMRSAARADSSFPRVGRKISGRKTRSEPASAGTIRGAQCDGPARNNIPAVSDANSALLPPTAPDPRNRCNAPQA